MNTQAWADALRQAALPTPDGLKAWNGSDPGVRFAVYRNNVRLSLITALAETFPVVRRCVGAQFFDLMAAAYVAEQPPTSPVLAHYGEGFADWAEHFEPIADRPWLGDMARLERSRIRAYHAADAAALDTAAIAAKLADPARLPHARLRLHPAVSVLASRHAIVSLWAAHQPGAAPADRDGAGGPAQCAFVHREGDDVLVLAVPAATGAFYQRLQQGAPLGEAAALDGTDFDLGASLALLIRHGALSAWLDPEQNT